MKDFLTYDKFGDPCIDFNNILIQRFSEKSGWEATRSGDTWKFVAVFNKRRYGSIPPEYYYEDVPLTIEVDISSMIHKSLIFPIDSPICGCSDLIEFGDYVEAECKNMSVYELSNNHFDEYFDKYYISPMHKELSDYVRKIIQEGKNRLWNGADPYGRMQPRIGWSGNTVPWFKTNSDGTAVTDEYGGLISNGTMEMIIRSASDSRL